MKILHIGDIHLGCTLENMRRNQEISRVFNEVCSIVRTHHVQAALLAGDIFDNGSPSNESLELYYSFLGELLLSGCRQVVIIAGNHDSASFLAAPGGLLRKMNIHIVAKVDPDHLENEVILLRDDSDVPAAYVCAVPYLRERDLRAIAPEGESSQQQTQALRQALSEHYRKVFRIADDLRGANKALPVIGMGHFYASGSSFASGNDDESAPDHSSVRVGTLDAVDISAFAEGFSYMALGHLHKPQCAAGCSSWRYAGSILPMNFQENPVKPQVVLLDTQDLSSPEILPLPESCFHKMSVIRGNMEELCSELSALCQNKEPIWVKPVYTGEEFLPNWALELRRKFHSEDLQILAPEIVRTKRRERDQMILEDQKRSSLARLTPEQLFLTHLEKKNEITSPEQKETLLQLFRSAREKVLDPSLQKETDQKISEGGLMRFKRLFIRNVNSLYGDHLIDFESEAFNSGIFLISGSTGAGKSSILDAICLALYGCTPRVSKISEKQNSVMSEGTHEMSCELTFSLGETLYRACFRQVRTIRAQNPFKSSEHKLYKNGVPVEIRGKKEIGEEIVRLIGMDEAEFTRCVLLAQGSFDAFLKAKASERSEILKSITGTGIYTRIGQEINQSFNQAQDQYNLTKKKLQGITFLEEEDLKKLTLEKQQCAASLQTLEKQIQSCNSFEELFRNVEQSTRNVSEAQNALNAAQTAYKASGEERREYSDAARAQKCQKEFDSFTSAGKLLASLRQDHLRLTEEAVLLKQDLAQKNQLLDTKRESLRLFMEEYDSKRQLFEKIRLLDHSVAETEKLCAAAKRETDQIREDRAKAQQEYEKELALWEETQKKTLAASQYLETRAEDALLEQKRPKWELLKETLNKTKETLAREQEILARQEKELQQTEGTLLTARNRIREAEAVLQEKTAQIETFKKEYDSLLDGKDPEEIRLAGAAAEKLSDFFRGPLSREEYLQESEPCPLCGSRRHPYCEGTPVPEEDSRFEKTALLLKERLKKIDQCTKTLKDLEKEHNDLQMSLQKKRLQEEHLAETFKNTRLQLDQRIREYETSLAEYEGSQQAFLSEIGQALQCSTQDPSLLFELLAERIRDYRSAVLAADSRTGARQRFDNAAAVFKALQEQTQPLLEKKSSELSLLEKEWKTKREERTSLFGSKNADQESAALEAEAHKIRQEQDEAQKYAIHAGEALKNNHLNQEKLSRSIRQQEMEVSALEKELEAALQKADFVSLDEFRLKRRSQERIDELTHALQKIDLELQKTQLLLAERQQLLADFTSRIPEGLKREENLLKKEEFTAEAESIRERFTSAEVELRKDQENRSEHEKTAIQLEEERILFNHWDYLNDNFGSTPGPNGADRFGRIAQGYTFRELLYFANANRLGSLRDHFTLVNDRSDPLELNVIDHYRADQERTSRNLSGGESFEVSLALALGLAEMSSMSQNAKLGNVLLDEGFGTLDDNTLSSALDLLMQLKNTDGKLVGIISHVEKLKDRIEAKIEVNSSSGMGVLSGAGVVSGEKLQQFLAENHPEEKTLSGGKTRRKKAP